MSSTEERKVSPTAQITPDVVGLGQTSGQRTAEIFAGLRAELMDSPEITALSRISGRIFARIISAIASKKILNFVPLRLNGFMELSRTALASAGENPILVDTAAGFAPRGILLAREMPHLKVIEVDLPGVIRDKQQRFANASIEIPPNLEWRTADLGVTPLSEVLEGQEADVITSEGLLHYFSHVEITSIAKHFYQSLKPGGSFICDIGYRVPVSQQETSSVISFFTRKTQSDPSKGLVSEKATAEKLFVDADYDPIVIYSMPEIAEKYNLEQPAPDYLYFIQAFKPDGTQQAEPKAVSTATPVIEEQSSVVPQTETNAATAPPAIEEQSTIAPQTATDVEVHAAATKPTKEETQTTSEMETSSTIDSEQASDSPAVDATTDENPTTDD